MTSEQTNAPSGLQIGTGVRPVATERLHSQGNLAQTNGTRDVAIKGQGFSMFNYLMVRMLILVMALFKWTKMGN